MSTSGEKDEIPVFSDMTVYFQQIGDIAAPQKPLTSTQGNRLRQIFSCFSSLPGVMIFHV